MHPARVIAAMIVGGYASILAAHLIAEAARPALWAAGEGVVLGPLAVGVCAAIIAPIFRSPAR